jgi:cyclopropane fatty-acyl-phospholipid synthase-like methyltransferase
MPIAIETDAANGQHYELPPEFFVACLGPNLKYTHLTLLAPSAAWSHQSCAQVQRMSVR